MTSRRVTATTFSILAAVVALPLAAQAAAPGVGAAGVGEPYYPLDGNGGYDVGHYALAIDYAPATDVLQGVATISAETTQPLTRFNLDLDGLRVRSVTVDGTPAARWTHSRGELVITPARALADRAAFTTVVTYGGTPELIAEPDGGGGGVLPTDDGALILGEPHVASSWFPVNDHPTDKATYTVAVTVPEDLEVVGNGVLVSSTTSGGKTTWTWDATDPMASYLATASIGEFDLTAYSDGGLPYWDAVDPDLYGSDVPVPTSGSQFLYSQQSPFEGASYKRVMRTVEVPANGPAVLQLEVDRATEQDWDFFIVEAHTPGADDWTTLRDLEGHNSQYTGFACPFWLQLHPFLEHYQTPAPRGGCSPSGTTGEWWAATGRSDGWETWRVDLSRWAGGAAEVSVSYVSDDTVQDRGVFLDDVVTPTGAGSSSFERGRDPLAGWQVAGPPAGSSPNPNDWIVTSASRVAIDTVGEQVDASFARQPEIIDYLASLYGAYPFAAAGGTVDDLDAGFALENQTRPVYSPVFWLYGAGDSVVVHELAHQWYGDHVSVQRWRDIWLNEGFATYSEWLWSEHEGLGTTDETFDFLFNEVYGDPDDPFWDVVIGDPGPELLFDSAVYDRGAMTVHRLRRTIGDEAFFALLEAWPTENGGGNGTVEQFIALAEEISGQQLDVFFQTWLYTPAKPVLDASAAGALTADQSAGKAPASAKAALARTAAEEFRTR